MSLIARFKFRAPPDPATLPRPPPLSRLPAAQCLLAPLMAPPSPKHRLSGWLAFELLAAPQVAELLCQQLYMMGSLLLPGTMGAARRLGAGAAEDPDLRSWKGMGIVLALNPWVGDELDLMIRSFVALDRLFLRPTVAKEQMVEEWLVELIWRGLEALDAAGAEVAADAGEVAGLLEFQRRAVEWVETAER